MIVLRSYAWRGILLGIWFLGVLFCPSIAPAKTWDPRLKTALQYCYAGNPAAAVPLIQAYQKEHPRDPNGLFVAAMVEEWQAGLGPQNHRRVYPDLIKIYQQANRLAFHLWEKNPEDVDALVDFGNSYFLLARLYGKNGSKMKAGLTGKKSQKHLEKAMALDPARSDALLPIGAFHYFAGNTPDYWKPLKAMFGIKGDKEEGLAELKRALEGEHPYVWNANYALMEIYQNSEKNWREAMKYWKVFADRFPQNPLVNLKYAQILELKDKQEAVQAYLNFAAACEGPQLQCPKKFVFYAYSQAGRLLEDLGQKTAAKQRYEQSLQFDPGDYPERIEQIQQWLQALGIPQ